MPLGLELVRLQRNSAQVIGSWLEGELHVALFPAVRLAVDRNFIELVLRFMPKLKGQLDTRREFLNFDFTFFVADTNVRVVGYDVISGHPRVDVAFDLGRSAFCLLDLNGLATTGRNDLIPFLIVEENELGVVAGAIGVLDFDGLTNPNR